MMLSDVADLNRDHSEEETKDVDDGFEDASSSDDDLTEYVERSWKKNDDTTPEHVEELQNVKWEYGVQCSGPQDLFVHDDDVTPPEELKVKAKFEGLFENPVKGVLAYATRLLATVLLMTNKNAHKQREASSRGHFGGRPYLCDSSLGR
ncbi:hypothetical protein AC1031_017318 [Aphanomyces cochlioides]|nr:hypothetical protein AC1031_017318 [Aphanomyces cochlioides]